MSFKLVAILSVIVLAALGQVHDSNEDPTLEAEYLSKIETLMQVELLVERIGEEIEESLLQNTTAEVNETESLAISEEYFTQAQATSVLENLLEKFKELVDATYDKKRQFVEFAKSEINKAADNVVTLGNQQLQAVAYGFKAELDELKEKAKAAGKNISNCLEENEDRLLELPVKYSGEVLLDLSKEVLYVESYFEDVQKQGPDLDDKIVHIREDIDKCERGLNRYICIAKMVFRVAKDIVTLPVMFEMDMKFPEKVLSEFRDDVANWILEKLTKNMIKEGNDILTAIHVCSALK